MLRRLPSVSFHAFIIPSANLRDKRNPRPSPCVKACKSYLRLGKDCRSVSYDAMTAHVAVVCTRYMLLAVEERENIDGRSFGERFFLSLDESPDLKYAEALRLVMQEFVKQLRAEYPSESRLAESLLNRFVQDLPLRWMRCLSGQKCAGSESNVRFTPLLSRHTEIFRMRSLNKNIRGKSKIFHFL